MSATTAPPTPPAHARGAVLPRERPEPRGPVVTRSETAECTCPEACERDHEQD
jgi:hypothetical protein